MSRIYLGIDTSCYTTSCALVDEEGKLQAENRRLLTVKPGARGLRQSEMVFQHTRNLPDLLTSLPVPAVISGIGVSAFPRRSADSYMPAFLAGAGQARSLAHFLNCPLIAVSHQENHILAALREVGELPAEPFYALHVSGGTTDLLYCHIGKTGLPEAELLGTSVDIHGGQFIDRVGVALGMTFPAGPALEKAAGESSSPGLQLPVAVKNGQISFGGPCSEAMRQIDKKQPPEQLAAAVMVCIAESLIRMLTWHRERKPVNRLVAVGGVMANLYLREQLKIYTKRQGMDAVFASPCFSADNATGAAWAAALLADRKE